MFSVTSVAKKSRAVYMLDRSFRQGVDYMPRPVLEESVQPIDPCLKLFGGPANFRVVDAAGSASDLSDGGTGGKQEFHHAWVNHAVGEFLVGALHAKLIAKLCRFEIDIVEAKEPGHLVEKALSTERKIRQIDVRQLYDSIAELIGAGGATLPVVRRNLVVVVAELDWAKPAMGFDSSPHGVVGVARVSLAEDAELRIFAVVSVIAGGSETPVVSGGECREVGQTFLALEIRVVGRRDCEGQDNHKNEDNNGDTTHRRIVPLTLSYVLN